MIPLASFAIAGCLVVGPAADRVTAGDFAPALEVFRSLPPDTPLALAPAPGVQRVFRTPELRRLAIRWNIAPPGEGDICIERPVAPLDAARILEAIQRQLPKASVEILEFSRLPVPAGDLEFPLSGLRPIPGGGFWSGAVRYAGNRRFVVWAKVKLLVETSRVIATVDLKPAKPVTVSELRVETHREFPDPTLIHSIEDAAGRVLRRPVPAGTPLRSQWLDPPSDIARGETVRVDVWNGGAHLEIEAEAEASGSAGDTIPLRNPVSNKRFLARVEGKGKATVGKGSL